MVLLVGRVASRQFQAVNFFLIKCVKIYLMSWGTKKRNFILTIFFSIIFLLVAFISFVVFYKPPNCFDGKQNGNETGVDCGGDCELLCSEQTLDPMVHWVRYFKIAEGYYSVLAYVENQNFNAGITNIPYLFKIYDDKNVILSERNGYITLNPREIMPISETNLHTGELDATRVSFEFLEDFIWKKMEKRETVLIIKDEKLQFDGEVEKITAAAINSSLDDIKKVIFVVIVYDVDNNAMATSATLIDEIKSNEQLSLLFTWPREFQKQVSRFEIIPIYQ
jgi:hypothetical protein